MDLDCSPRDAYSEANLVSCQQIQRGEATDDFSWKLRSNQVILKELLLGLWERDDIGAHLRQIPTQ